MHMRQRGWTVSGALVLLLVGILCLLSNGPALSEDPASRIGPFTSPAGDLPWIEDEVLIQLSPSATDSDLAALNAKYGASVAARSQYKRGFCKLKLSTPVTDETVRRIQSEQSVLAAVKNYKRYVTATPNDPLYPLFRYPDYLDDVYGQWAYQYDPVLRKHHIWAPQAWDIMKGRNNVVVAVIDTGVRVDPLYSDDGKLLRRPHPDLGRWSRCPTDQQYPPMNYVLDELPSGVRMGGRLLDGIDLANEDTPWDEAPTDSDDPVVASVAPHGTMVSGVIAAKTNNEQGVAGLCWNGVWILPIKVQPNDASYLDGFACIDAIWYCIWWRNSSAVRGQTLKVDVINMSYGSQLPDPLERSAIASAVQSGIVCVASSGNDWGAGPYPPVYPAAYEGVICVGATDFRDAISSFSQQGHAVDIAAPGEDIYTTYWNRRMVDEDAINEIFHGDPPDGQGGIDVCNPDAPPIVDPRPPRREYPPYEPTDVWGNGYRYASGTSFAAPMVAAAAALLRSLGVPPADVWPILRDTASPVSVGRPNDAFGYGLLNVYEAVKTACIDVKIQSPANGSTVLTRRPKIRVDLRRADLETVRVWIDAEDTDGDGVPDGEPVFSGSDSGAEEKYVITDPDGGKGYVLLEVELSPGRHKVTAQASSNIELDEPPSVPLSDEDTAWFIVAPQTLNRGWHLLAVPFWLERDTTPMDLFAGNTGVLARWHYANGPNGEYAIYSLDGTRMDPEASFFPPSVVDEFGYMDEKLVHPSGMPFEATPPAGLGYWAYLVNPLEFPEAVGTSVDTGPYEIGLYTGWNMVGNPFPFAVDWASVVVEYAGQRMPARQAVQEGWIFGYVFRYDNVYRRYKSQPIDSAVMKPWEAVWLRARVRGPYGWPQADLKLIVPPTPYTGVIR